MCSPFTDWNVGNADAATERAKTVTPHAAIP